MFPLTAFERTTALSIFDTIYPRAPHGSLPMGAGEMDVGGYFDETFAQAPFESGLGLRAAIWICAVAPLFVLRRFSSFEGLSVEEREGLLLTLMSSRIYFVRSLVLALKAVGSLLYCGHPLVRARVLNVARHGKSPAPPLVALRTKNDSAKSDSPENKAPEASKEKRHESRSFA